MTAEKAFKGLKEVFIITASHRLIAAYAGTMQGGTTSSTPLLFLCGFGKFSLRAVSPQIIRGKSLFYRRRSHVQDFGTFDRPLLFAEATCPPP
jgi:hypothetical protein